VPEGDTVHLAARRLDRALSGRLVTSSDLRVPRYSTTDLSGRRVLGVVARGKHLLFRLDGDLTLHTHYKMEGSWHLYRQGERWRGPAFQVRAVLTTDNWVAVGFRLATTEVIATSSEGEVLGHLGPDVLGDDWDLERAAQRIQSDPSRSISEALLDQRNVAGFGNVYRTEICFLRGVDPWTEVRNIDVRAMLALGKKLMEANRSTGEQITTGDERSGRKQWVYGRGGQPCRRCGTDIRRADATGERVTYWCPRCQPRLVDESVGGGMSVETGYSGERPE
jgi:endonuclease VIII